MSSCWPICILSENLFLCWWVQVIPFFLFYQIQSILSYVEVLDPSEVEVCAFDRYIYIYFHSSTWSYPAPFVDNIFFQCVCYSLVFIKKTGICRYMEFYWTYNLQFDFIYQWVNFVFQCYAVSITIALKYSLKSVRMIHASVLILLEIILAILGFLCFHMMSTFFSILVKNWLHLVF